MEHYRGKFHGIIACLLAIIVITMLAAPALAQQDPNLVGWWKFDESTGKIAYDSSGYNNHITLQINAAYASNDPNYIYENDFVPGVSGNALELDGKWKTAYVPHDDILGPTKEVTFSIWLKSDVLEKECWIFNKGDTTRRYFGISEDGSDYKLVFDIHTVEIATGLSAHITAAEFADNQWHLYTCVYDGQSAYIYRDGTVLAQMECPGEIAPGDGAIYLGSCSNYCPTSDPGVVHYDGLMDDFRIYNRALTQQEILELAGSADGPTDPQPAFGEKSVDVNTVMSWTPSSFAQTVDIYMGTDAQAVESADISSPEFMTNQSADVNTFDPSGLNAGTIYYWRVDEINDVNIITGSLWNFETLGYVEPNLIGWWKFDEELGNIAYDSTGNNNNAVIAGNPVRQAGVIDNAVELLGTNEYAEVPNESFFDIAGNLTISAWIKVSTSDTSSMYIISKSESYRIFKDLDSNVLTFLCEGTGRPVTGTVNIADGQWHHIAGVYDGSNKYIYVDGQLDNYMRSSGAVLTNDNPLYIGDDAIWADNEFNGLIDDARVYDKALDESEIAQLASVRFAFAHDPAPADGTVYIPVDQALSWTPGNSATSHDIYFGTDYDAVLNADTSSAEYIGNRTANSYSPTLDLSTTYYWRIDEVGDSNLWTGNVWAFSTTDELPDPNLIGHWTFNAGYGYTVYDISGNGNHGNVKSNSVWTATKDFMHFYVGTDPNGGIEIENEHPFDITDEITIATWIYHSGWERWDNYDTIIGKGSTAYKLYRNGGWLGTDEIQFRLEGVASITTTEKSYTGDEKWHHIAATYDGSAISVYLDGQLNNSNAASGQIATNSEKLWLGNDPITKKDFSRGHLRDTRIYNRALTAEEIDLLATPLCASRPSPADDVDSVCEPNLTLSWRPGKGVDSQNFYFSSDYAEVQYDTPTGNSYITALNPDCNNYDINDLEGGKYYYWRVDQIEDITVYKGKTWSFYVPSSETPLEGDVNFDNKVDLNDYAMIADKWTYVEPNEPNTTMFQCTSSAGDDDINLSLNGISVALDTDDLGNTSFITSSDDIQYLSLPGEPAIPYKTTTVLLPADVDLATVQANFTEVIYKTADGTWQVKPTDPMVTWIDGQEITDWPQDKTIIDGKDTAIYENNALWPASEIIFTGKGQLRKYNVATIAVPLVRYNPVTAQLQRLAMADIAITYSTTMATNSALLAKADPTGQNRIENLAINFDQMIDSYGYLDTLSCGDGPLPGYIIMTTNFIVENSQELDNFIAHKQAMGFDVNVVTQDQWGGDTGDDAAENMRSWLKENWSDDGIADYLLLIGNPDPGSDLPMKNTHGNSYGLSVTDFYYATITGSWDLDGDEDYGESSSDVSDVYYELMVGRIPFYGVIADLDHILDKTIDFECQFPANTQWRKNTLSAMKPLNTSYGTSWAFGEDMARDIFDPAGWPYFKLYDMTHLPEGLIPDATPCSYYTFTNIWSTGKFGSVIYSTHGGGDGDTTSEVIKTSLLHNMNDRYPGIIFGASCWGAKPEAPRNIIYRSVLNGAIAGLGSTRPSWYSPSQTNFNNSGSCEGQGYEFYERLVQGQSAGKAMYELKQQQQFSWWTNNKILNLYGDPAIIMKPIEPADLNQDRLFDFKDMAILSRRWLDAQ